MRLVRHGLVEATSYTLTMVRAKPKPDRHRATGQSNYRAVTYTVDDRTRYWIESLLLATLPAPPD